MRQKRVHPLEPIPETKLKATYASTAALLSFQLLLDELIPLCTCKHPGDKAHPVRSSFLRPDLPTDDDATTPSRLSTLASRPHLETAPDDVAFARTVLSSSQFARTLPGATRKISRWVRAAPLKDASRSTAEAHHLALRDAGRNGTTCLASVASSTRRGGAVGARCRHNASSQGRRQLESGESKPASNTGRVGVCHKDPIPSSACRCRHRAVIMARNQGFGIRSAKVRQFSFPPHPSHR